MKKIIILLFVFKFYLALGQVDTCQCSNAAYNYFYNDAHCLAQLDAEWNTANPYHDSLHIPPFQTDRILKSLCVLYNDTSAERDTVINLYNIHWIHTGCNYPMKMIPIGIDTSVWWIKNFINDSIISGNPTFDSIVSGNNFKLIYYSPFFEEMIIGTDSVYNLQPVVQKLSTIPGIIYTDIIIRCPGDGDAFSFNPGLTYDSVTFRHGWDDCPSGCYLERFWFFKVYPNCISVFDSSLGNHITSIEEYTADHTILVYPNPASDKITISNYPFSGNESTVEIYNMMGEKVYSQSKFINQKTEIDVSTLATGVYLIQVRDGEKILRGKMIKE